MAEDALPGVGKYIDKVETFGLGRFNPRTAAVEISSHSPSMTQETHYKARFELNNVTDCRQFLSSFNPDMMVQLFGNERAVAMAIDTVTKSKITEKDSVMIGNVMEIGGDTYRGNKSISGAIARFEAKAKSEGLPWGEQLKQALAKNAQAKEEAIKIR